MNNPNLGVRKLLIDWGGDWAAIEENGERIHEDHVDRIFEKLARAYVGENNINDNWEASEWVHDNTDEYDNEPMVEWVDPGGQP